VKKNTHSGSQKLKKNFLQIGAMKFKKKLKKKFASYPSCRQRQTDPNAKKGGGREKISVLTRFRDRDAKSSIVFFS
jgi:hypothetical protein